MWATGLRSSSSGTALPSWLDVPIPRKHVLLLLPVAQPAALQVMLPRIPASATPVVFSRNFCRTLANNLSKGDTYLHAMTKKVIVSGFSRGWGLGDWSRKRET
jgi:hypothetical protein